MSRYTKFLEDELGALQVEETNTEEIRETLDADIRANTRTLFRDQLLSLRSVVDSEEEKAAVDQVLAVLAAPGPETSASKRIHELTRQAGTKWVQQIRSRITRYGKLLDDARTKQDEA